MYEDKPRKHKHVSLTLKVTPEINRKIIISASIANRSKASEVYHRLIDHLENFQLVVMPDNSFVYEDTSLLKKLDLK